MTRHEGEAGRPIAMEDGSAVARVARQDHRALNVLTDTLNVGRAWDRDVLSDRIWSPRSQQRGHHA